MLLVVIRRSALAIAVAASLVALAACTDDGGATTVDRDRITACGLLTPAEVGSALGGDVRPPEATDDASADALAGRSGCAWATRDDEAAALIELVRTDDMSPSVRRTGFSANARFSAARSRHPEAEPVDVGDRGLWVDEAATLYVLASRSYVVVEVAVQETSRAKQAAIALAVPAVRRLASSDGAD